MNEINYMPHSWLLLLILFYQSLAKIQYHDQDFDAVSNTNTQNYDTGNLGDFRLKKYNDIWDQVQNQNQLSIEDQRNSELLTLDKHNLVVKHEQASGKKGNFSSAVKNIDKQLISLLRNFGLHRLAEKIKKNLISDDDPKDKQHDDQVAGSDVTQHSPKEAEKIIAQDVNLLKLWNDAKNSGFNDQELLDLQSEFVHYADRQREHKKLQSEKADDSSSRNSVSHHFEEKNGDQQIAPEAHSNIKLKQQNKLLNENFVSLIEKIENEKVRSAAGQLKNTKAKALYEKALKSGSFSDQQMEDLLVELKHFDDRLEKLKFVQEDLAGTKFKLNKMGKVDHHGSKLDEYAVLERKYNDYEKKAQKLEAYLADKIEL